MIKYSVEISKELQEVKKESKARKEQLILFKQGLGMCSALTVICIAKIISGRK